MEQVQEEMTLVERNGGTWWGDEMTQGRPILGGSRVQAVRLVEDKS